MSTDDILRVRYRQGQFLSALDFTDEQAYQVESRRRHYVGEHTWGIVSGLEITKNASNIWVVTAGYMVDAYGRDTWLFEDEPLDPVRIGGSLQNASSPTLKIWLAHRVEETSPSAGGFASCRNDVLNTRTRESFRLIYQDDPVPFNTQQPDDRTKWPTAVQDLPADPAASPWPVLLGTITWDPAGQAITSVNPTGRQYAGLRGIEVFSQTDRFDVHATTLEIAPPGAGPGVLTTTKAPLTIRTDDTAAHGVLFDRDDVQIDNNLHVVKDAKLEKNVGNGAGMLFLETGAQEGVLTCLATPRNIAIRTDNGNGNNKVLIDKDDVTLKSLDVAGPCTFKGGVELHGGELIFKDANGFDNTDPLTISRSDPAPNHSDLRIRIGDDIGGDDRLVVGPIYHLDNLFKEQFWIDNAGNVFAKGVVNGRNMVADGLKLDGISANAKNVVIASGTASNGGPIFPPVGFTVGQCRVLLSPSIQFSATTYAIRELRVVASANFFTVHAIWEQLNGFFSSSPVAGSVEYLLIAVQ